MTQAIQPQGSFLYQAQTPDGQPISGTIEAAGVEQAQRLLTALRLRVLNIESTATPAAVTGKRLRPEDFFAFNQQLAHLTSAGMPIEQGLRLIAQDMRSGRMADTIRDLASEMERGTSLEQAFDKFQDRFPPLYSKLVGAGVTSGNLPGMLFNLGRHMELIERLRAALWRAAAYPITILIGVVVVLYFVTQHILPKFDAIFRDFGTKLPALTEWLMMLPAAAPYIFGTLAVIVIALILGYFILKSMGLDRIVIERIVFPLPLIGPILRFNLLARWCDAVAMAIAAGLDLPRAVQLAGDAVASPTLRKDGDQLIATLQSGQPISTMTRGRILPATAIAAMSLASQQSDLGSAMNTLSEMYQQQAQLRLSLLPALLTPALLLIVATTIGAIVIAMFLPMISLIQNISSPMKK